LDKKHEAWLRFVREIVNIPAGLSKQDLYEFRSMAIRDNPAIADVVSAYIELAERSDSGVQASRTSGGRTRTKRMHLFDLLREKAFFPQNSDLARFASRVVPGMRSYRFDKMSRANIASRIIEYLEESGPGNRVSLEESMRDALAKLGKAPPEEAEDERRSFLSKWERIIKGLEF
jgi:hypothetical protein